ncbi:MAG: hypothetical protein E7677_04335 [Ruminococcaceae bacterium]|nr:hypothetical protein [Oscillospiraceae bacterium]
MQKHHYNYIKNLLFPCLFFSVVAGFFSAIAVTAFKLAAEFIIHLSVTVYDIVRANPVWLPILVIGASVIGLASSFILSWSRSCRGGGIPTSVAAIRGIVSFKWLASVFILPYSALLTLLCGIPLGTEGPCVQMGTAIGDGVVKCFGGKKHKGWRQYIMTGGASAGFSIATSSPLTAIIFSMEELHKHFSPLLLTVVSLSVISSQVAVKIMALFGIGASALFDISTIAPLSLKFIFAPLIVGLICGGISIVFTRLYCLIEELMRTLLKKVSLKIVFPILFAFISVVGFFLSDTLGTGHSLSESLLHTEMLWYILILVFLVRALIMIIANTSGVTGGIFLPALAFGAIIGSLCAKAMIALGIIAPEHYTLIVVLGITAFLGASSRIPITACVLAIESLGGINNVIYVVLAVTVAFLAVELSGIEDFTDIVLEAKIRAIIKGKNATVVEVPLTVQPDSFAEGKELRDILWPGECRVVSYEREGDRHHKLGILPGDVITVHYKTYDPAVTATEIKNLVGEQSDDIEKLMNPKS